MLKLTGILRQSGRIQGKDDKAFTKVWVEHETPARDDRPGDLQILEFLLPEESNIPAKGEEISLDVRAYASGRDVRFQALGVAEGSQSTRTARKAVETK